MLPAGSRITGMAWGVVPGLHMYCCSADPAQHLKTADLDGLDDLQGLDDISVDDLSDL